MEEQERKELWQRVQGRHDKEIAALTETIDLLMEGVFGLMRKKRSNNREMKLKKQFIQCEMCNTNFGESKNRDTIEKRNRHMEETGHNKFGTYDTFLYHKFGFKTSEKRIFL